MKISEKKIEKRCKDVARANGWWVRKFSSPANVGVPDDVFLKEGRVVWVEFKAPGKEPTKLQEHELNQILNHGGEAYWTSDVDEFKKFMGIHT